MQNKITKQKLDKYKKITQSALAKAKNSIAKSKQEQAKEIIKMVECYLADAEHFEKQANYVNAFACINYAHGWLDCGARLKIFNVKDNKLFTI